MVLGIVSAFVALSSQASGIAAVVICSVLSLIFGIISLTQKKPGKGMAIAGVVLAASALVITVITTIICVATWSVIGNGIPGSYGL